MTVDFLSLANDLASKGWEPLALPKGQKFPPPPGTTGADGVPLPPERWADYPDHDAAVRMPRGVVGLDWDDYRVGGDALTEQAALELLHGELPDTWSTSSRRFPSRIDYYRLPEGHEDVRLPGSVGCLDVIQRQHRYARVSGIHADTGVEYRWIDPDGNHQFEPPYVEDLPELPIGWLELSPPEPAAQPEPAERYEATSEVLSALREGLSGLSGAAGSRHDAVAAAVMTLANLAAGGHDTTAALAALHAEWMRTMTEERGERVADEEFTRMVESAKAKAVPAAPPQEAVQAFLEEMAEPSPIAETDGTNGTDGERKGWKVENFLDILDEPPRDYVVKGLIPQDSFTAIYGQFKSGKTFYALDLGMTLATAGSGAAGAPADFHGKRVRPRKVAYVYGESRSSFRNRWNAWLQAKVGIEATEGAADGLKAALGDRFKPIPAFGHDLTHLVEAEGLVEALKATEAEIVFIDTLKSVTPSMEENSGGEDGMGAFLRSIDLIRSCGCDVVVVHHTPKGSDTLRGHTSLPGALDAGILVKKDRDDEGRRAAEITASLEITRDFEDGERSKFGFRVHDVGYDVDGDPETSVTLELAAHSDADDKDDEGRKRLVAELRKHGRILKREAAVVMNIRKADANRILAEMHDDAEIAEVMELTETAGGAQRLKFVELTDIGDDYYP